MTDLFLYASAKSRALAAGAALATGLLAAATPAFAELKVTVTIKPVHALVAQVMQGVGTPTLLVQGAASPHTYALKPSDAKALNSADVFFRVSENVEPFTRKIVAALPDTVRTVTLAEAPGIELLSVRTGETFEKHEDHDHAEEQDHGKGAHDDLGPDAGRIAHGQQQCRCGHGAPLALRAVPPRGSERLRSGRAALMPDSARR